MRITRMTVYEMLNNVSSLQTEKERIALLKEYDCFALRTILQGMFDDRIIFIVPKEITYKKLDISKCYRIHSECRRFYLLVKGGSNLPEKKIVNIYTDILESIDSEDADLVIEMVNKSCSLKNITKTLVAKTFKGLLDT